MKKMIYPSSISFNVTRENNCLSVSYEKEKSKYQLDIWALARLLNEGLDKDGINKIHFQVDDITTALRLYFLTQAKLFSQISWDIKYLDNLQQLVKEITQDINHEKYITYEQPFCERNPKQCAESLLEDNLCKDLSRLSIEHFDKSSQSIRQFHANIFLEEIFEKNRITSKFMMDILTINKHKQLSVIELKAGKSNPLDLFVQALNYGIYCHLFKSHINKYFFNDTPDVNNNKIAIYFVAENFHPGLVGREKDGIIGVQSLIQPNILFDFIFIKIKTDGNHSVIDANVLFDTRCHESNHP